MNKENIMAIIVLPLLCLIMGGLLALSESVTRPVIEVASAARAETARKEIIPQADNFELLGMEALLSKPDFPKTITAVYKTTNNTGYVFMITTSGYGGEIKLICGISTDGNIIKTATLSQTETKGLGSPVFDEPHAGQYWGRDKKGIEDIAAISGATISSTAYKNGMRDAFVAFEIVKGSL